MPRIYTEIRIAHGTKEKKEWFEETIDTASMRLLGKIDRAEFIRTIVNLDAATGIIENLNTSKIIDFLMAENMAIMALMKIKGIATDNEFELAYKAAREHMREKLEGV